VAAILESSLSSTTVSGEPDNGGEGFGSLECVYEVLVAKHNIDDA
jgi:hypothetical protein